MFIRSTLATALICSLAGAAGAAEPDGPIHATLELAPRKLDPEGSRSLGMMYMPSGAKLSDAKPVNLTNEPKYRGTPKYVTIPLGNGANTDFTLAFDEPEGDADARVYLDLNGNGDLTDDGEGSTGEWTKKDSKEGAAAQYSGTWNFQPGFISAEGKETTGEYALNFYRSADRDNINYYRASARTGKIKIGGKEYEALLIENDNDGLFDKLYDPSKATPADKLPKPVTLQLDGDRMDIRGTFGFGDYNYIARVSADGSKISMESTNRLIKLPRPTERPQMLGAGVPVPDFEATWWVKDASAGSKPEMFKIADFKNKKIVVLDMWATWCGPCMAGIPHLSKIAEAVKDQNVEVIALNVWDEPKAYERFVREKGKNYAFRIARDLASKDDREASIASRCFKLSGIPATYVIDKSGNIVASVSGYQAGDKQIEHALVRLGVKIDGITPEDAAKELPKKPTMMLPATGMK